MFKKLSWIVFLVLGWVFVLNAQTLTIHNHEGKPIWGVQVYDSAQLIGISNQDGQVQLSNIEAEFIDIQHIGVSPTQIRTPKADTTIQLIYESTILDEVIISANRWEQNQRELSTPILSLSPKDIEQFQVQNAADILSSTGLAYVQKSQQGGGSPMLRGFSANRVLVAVDGIRMNTAIFRSGNVHNLISIDPFSIQNIEVLYGPSSIIYGSDALGGVMDYHTFNTPFENDSLFAIHGKASMQYNQLHQTPSMHAALSYGNHKWKALSSASYLKYDDLKMGSHGPDAYLRTHFQTRINQRDSFVLNPDPEVQLASAYEQWNFMQKLSFQWRANHRITAASIWSQTSDIPRYDRLIQMRNQKPRSAEWYYGPQLWNLNYLHYENTAPTNFYDAMQLKLAYQFFQESRHDRSWQSAFLRSRTEKVKMWTLNLDLDKETPWGSLFYGLDIAVNRVFSTANSKNIFTQNQFDVSTRYPNASDWASAAAYLHWRKNWGKHYFNAGFRYNHIYLFAPLNNIGFEFPFSTASLNFGNVTGSLGWAWNYRSNQKWHINLSSGFRAPNIDDIGKVFDSEPGAVVVPNAQLQAEYAWNADVGWTLDGNKWTCQIHLFYTHLDQAMVRRPFTFNGRDSILYDETLSAVQAIQNASSAYMYGFMNRLSYQATPKFALGANMMYQNGETLEGDETVPIRHIAPFSAQVFIHYEHDDLQARIQGNYNAAISPDRLAPSEAAKPHLYLLNEGGQLYSPSWYTLDFMVQKNCENFHIQGRIENITDQRYRPYSSGIVGAGRHFRCILSYHF